MPFECLSSVDTMSPVVTYTHQLGRNRCVYIYIYIYTYIQIREKAFNWSPCNTDEYQKKWENIKWMEKKYRHDSSISIAANLYDKGKAEESILLVIMYNFIFLSVEYCSRFCVRYMMSRRRWKRREAVPWGWWNNRVYYTMLYPLLHNRIRARQ